MSDFEKRVEDFKRHLLGDMLSQCSEVQQTNFLCIFPGGMVPVGKLDSALGLLERTIKKNTVQEKPAVLVDEVVLSPDGACRIQTHSAQPAPEKPGAEIRPEVEAEILAAEKQPLVTIEVGECGEAQPAPDAPADDMAEMIAVADEVALLTPEGVVPVKPAPSAASGWICRACLNKHGETALYRFRSEMLPGCQEHAESVLTEPWPEVTRTYRDPRLSEKKKP